MPAAEEQLPRPHQPRQIFGQVFYQIVDQISGQVFDQDYAQNLIVVGVRGVNSKILTLKFWFSHGLSSKNLV